MSSMKIGEKLGCDHTTVLDIFRKHDGYIPWPAGAPKRPFIPKPKFIPPPLGPKYNEMWKEYRNKKFLRDERGALLAVELIKKPI